MQLRHRLALRSATVRRVLADPPPPAGPYFMPPSAAEGRCAPAGDAVADLDDWHGHFDPARHALDLALFEAGDIRPVWEANRLNSLPLLAQAGRRDAAEALVAGWVARNPAFRGPAWACGQECGLRALHLGLALTLLDAAPGAGIRALLSLHARRIEATPAYAKAQDNNHPISEAAGLLVCGLMLADREREGRGARLLAEAVNRLVSPCGAFAQPSARYHRLLLDTLAVTALIWRRHRGVDADASIRARAAVATAWLRRIMDPTSGRLPRLGPEDPSCLADLTERGPDDARGSVERAAALFGEAELDRSNWQSAGWRGWQAGRLRVILRTGVPLCFRPAHADLLHLDLWLEGRNLLRDGGTGSYNPPAAPPWSEVDLSSARAHNLIVFDDAEPMPRVTRFLFARWPRTRLLPDGAETLDRRGMRHARQVLLTAKGLLVQDAISGPFREAILRWRLAPETWRLHGNHLDGQDVRLSLSSDAPLDLRLTQGWESPAYGRIEPVPVLEARVAAPASWMRTTLETVA